MCLNVYMSVCAHVYVACLYVRAGVCNACVYVSLCVHIHMCVDVCIPCISPLVLVSFPVMVFL